MENLHLKNLDLNKIKKQINKNKHKQIIVLKNFELKNITKNKKEPFKNKVIQLINKLPN